tara:strand:- start:46 stop:471 length:426 start_codon:yes stop_codon:yes gene_type:complete
MLSWKKYLKKGVVRKTSSDKNLIKSLIEIAEGGLKFFKDKEINEENAGIILKNYYDSLREICEAVAILKEYKIYQHEAITLFLKDILKEEEISFKFNRFRILRNSIHYYGKTISKKETLKAISDIKSIIKTLKFKYLKEDL